LLGLLCLVLDSENLSKFLWKDIKPVASYLFPQNLLGQYVLKRDRVVKKVKDAMVSQLSLHPEASQSIYLSGCRGSGKTCLLMLIARSLKAEGYEVYFFQSAQRIPRGACFEFEALLADKTKKVAVLIDEVATDPNSALFTALLKGAFSNLVTIGASVPRYIPTGLTAVFKLKLRMTDLVLKEEDEDFQVLVQYCVGLKATSPQMTQAICKHILKQCGGHTYPILTFIEHFFTSDSTKGFLDSEELFYRYFHGPDFVRTPFYESVRLRCFEQILESDTLKVAIRVMGGKEEASDISTMIRLGWWDPDTNDFISRFLMNVCLSGVKPGTDNVFYLDPKKSYEKNTEMVIIKGLSGMDDSDFKCWRHESGVKVEDGVSFNWACRARAKIPNAYLSFQERGESGRVDFYLNSFADTAIEVMLDATQTDDPKSSRQSQDIDGHLERFRSGKYPCSNYVLFNFVMSGDKILLPRDTSAQDKVYTFVRSTNNLYRGKNLIEESVIPSLSGGSRRSFSTSTSKLRAGYVRNINKTAKQLSLLMNFMTFCMKRL